MADQDEKYRLILEWIGADGVDDLNENLGYTRKALEQLREAYNRGEVETSNFLKSSDALTRQEQKLEAALKGVEQAMQAQANAAAEADKLAAGDAMRARIDGYVRAEEAAEQFAEAHRAAMEVVRQTEGDSMRARIDGYARAEQAAEQLAAATKAAAAASAAAQPKEYELADTYELAGTHASEAAVAIGDLTRRQEAQAAQAQWLKNQTVELDQALQAMHAHEASAPRAGSLNDLSGPGAGDAMRARIEGYAAAERATIRWADSMDQLKTKFGPASDGATNFARQMLFVSYAAQDFYQGGFSAIINNVPQLAMAFDIPTKAMGAMALGAIAVDIGMKTLGPTVRTLGADLGLLDDPTKTFVTNTDQMKVKLDALTSKTWKVDVDYKNIADAKKEMDDLQKAFAAYESGRQTAAEKDLAKQTSEVTNKYLGGTEGLRDKLLDAAGKGQFDLGEPEGDGEAAQKYRRNRERLAQLDKQLADPANAGFNPEDAFAIKNAETEAARLRNEIAQTRKDLAKAAAGRFNLGDDKTVQSVQALAVARPDLFDKVGPRGIDAAEAVTDLPPTRDEAERRAEWNADDKVREGTEKERRDRAKKQAEKERLDEASRQEGVARIAKEDNAKADAAAKAAKAKSTAEKKRNQRLRQQDAEARAKRQAEDRANPQAARMREAAFRLGPRIGVATEQVNPTTGRRMPGTGLDQRQSLQAAQGALQISSQTGIDLESAVQLAVQQVRAQAMGQQAQGQALMGAMRAIEMSEKTGLDFQSATLQVVQQMQQQAMAKQQQVWTMQGQLGTVQGQVRQMNGPGGGTQIANPFAGFE